MGEKSPRACETLLARSYFWAVALEAACLLPTSPLFFSHKIILMARGWESSVRCLLLFEVESLAQKLFASVVYIIIFTSQQYVHESGSDTVVWKALIKHSESSKETHLDPGGLTKHSLNSLWKFVNYEWFCIWKTLYICYTGNILPDWFYISLCQMVMLIVPCACFTGYIFWYEITSCLKTPAWKQQNTLRF